MTSECIYSKRPMDIRAPYGPNRYLLFLFTLQRLPRGLARTGLPRMRTQSSRPREIRSAFGRKPPEPRCADTVQRSPSGKCGRFIRQVQLGRFAISVDETDS
jgi:hypothetical protein